MTGLSRAREPADTVGAMEIGLAGVLAVLFAISFAREPRRMRCAVLLLGAVAAVLVELLGLVIAAFAERWDVAAAGWSLLAILALVFLLLVGVAVVLVLNGLTMVRREGRRPANLLSLALGLFLLAGMAAALAIIATDSARSVVVLLLTSLPAGYLAFGFMAYLLYSPLYQWHSGQQARDLQAIVVLGAGLIDGAVPPLLAGRLDRARRAYDDSLRVGDRDPLVVTSGGQGIDEPRSEASAMAEYLAEGGVPQSAIVVEDESRNTEENLANTATLLAERGITGPVAVVTSDFHTFRSAMVMRRTGIRGVVLGARTADYFLPNAAIREYLAILRDFRWFAGISLVVLTLPLVAFLASAAG